jgi:pimeloyl-ACP methyl ester carboxylesterase/DNA-binding SARP family transcriptional activator
VPAIEIRVLGDLEVLCEGRPLTLPPSRKTRALLAFLAVQAAPQRRDHLCELFWEAPDDPRAALRWSLTKLRTLLNAPDRELVCADRERVFLDRNACSVDVQSALAARTALERNAGEVEQIRQALALFRGPFLSGLELPRQPAFETWRLGQQERARRLQLYLLEALAAKLDPACEEFTGALRHQVALDPGDELAHARLIGALASTGAHAEAEQQRIASARILNALGPYDESALDAALRSNRKASARRAQPARPSPRQDIRFCTSPDGVRIAYATVGSGPPLLKTANWLNHLEFDWESPIWRHFFLTFAKDHTFVRYDSRGNGLSDWDARDLSLDALVSDLEAVADASGLERFPLLGISQGCPVAVAFAVRYPARVSKLILYGGYARGWRQRGDKALEQQQAAMITLARLGWGRDNPAFRQMFTSSFIPDATPEQGDWFNELQRVSTSPENAERLLRAVGEINVADLLPQVAAPTLVIHTRGDERVPLLSAIELASGIPDARLVTLEGQNHLLLEQEPAWPRFVDEVRAFLAA